VHVSAKDMATQKEQSMTITGGSGLSKEEIDRMMKDAEAHAEEDRRRKEEADIRNGAESLVYQTEKFLSENEDKVPADAKSNVTEPLAELKKLPAKAREGFAKKEGEASAGTFGNALDVATQVFTEHGEEFDQAGSDYQVIPIADARELGIMPIASGKK